MNIHLAFVNLSFTFFTRDHSIVTIIVNMLYIELINDDFVALTKTALNFNILQLI